MPIPTPQRDESHDEFMSRCMGSDTMQEEFPDSEQRSAVCMRQWRDHEPGALAPATAACWANHLGIWCVEPLWFHQALHLYKSGLWPTRSQAEIEAAAYDRRYQLQDHTAIIPIYGALTKGVSKYGGTSTLAVRLAIRQALRDEEVQGILLHVDSPGGHVAGIQELADAVYQARGIKPVNAHIDDLGASAAYWIASQTTRITANRAAEVGSIGTMAVIEDSSKRMDRLGVNVRVLASGPYKGIGVEGAPISDEALAYLQQRVNALNAHFLAALQRGRRLLTPDDLAQVGDGRIYSAAEAHRLHLIDAVQSLDEAASSVLVPRPTQAARMRLAAIIPIAQQEKYRETQEI